MALSSSAIPLDFESDDHIQVVRFIISGEPFDILWSILRDNKWKNTLLYQAADFSLHSKNSVAVSGPDRGKDNKIIVVELSRDIRSFRIIKHYIETGNAIIPPDSLDRELVYNETLYYGLTELATILSSNRKVKITIDQPVIVNKDEEYNENEKNDEKNIDENILKDGFITPSESIIRNIYPLYTKEQIPVPNTINEWKFWSKGYNDDLLDIDQKIRMDEILSRKNLYKTPDMAPIISSVNIFDTDLNNIQENNYNSLFCNNITPLKMVTSSEEFEEQFEAFTLGIIKNNIKGLPLVVAGGCILTCLHKWNPEPIAESLEEKYADKIDENNIIKMFVDYCNKNPITYESHRRYRNNDSDLKNEVELLKAKLYSLQSDRKYFNEKIKYKLGMLTTLSGIKFVNNTIRPFSVIQSVMSETDEKIEFVKEYSKIKKSLLKSDIDLFLTTRNSNEALTCIIEFYKRLKNTVSGEIKMMRTKHAITFILPWPYKTIQIIFRLYHSIKHVLLGFDIDCCCLAYDGNNVIGLPRGIRAIQTRSNILDTTRQSTSFETRLIKYAKRSFKICVPGVNIPFHIKNVNDTILQNDPKNSVNITGFSLLLVSLYSVHNNNSFLKKKYNIKISDYNSLSMKKIERALRRYTYNINKNYRIHVPYFVYGSKINEVLFNNYSTKNDIKIPSTINIISFQYNNPHSQDRIDDIFTGSFHPTFNEYYLQT